MESVRSLRAHNPRIPVTLFVFNGVSDEIRRAADHCRVMVLPLGSYRDWLQQYHPHGHALSLYPTLHKFLVLSEADTSGLSQALYVDCDTFFFHDPEVLFESGDFHWSAREAPTSRLCPHQYDPANINEEMIERIVAAEGLRWVHPFNAGVCLLNNGIWETFRQLRETFFDTVWRLLVGRHCWTLAEQQDYQIRNAVLGLASRRDIQRALPYPSQNFWILEEIALWLTLGHVQNLAQGFLDRRKVAQGYECVNAVRTGLVPVLAHYFTSFQRDFFRSLSFM